MRTEWEEGARSPSTLGYVRLGTNTPLDRLPPPTKAREQPTTTREHFKRPRTPVAPLDRPWTLTTHP
ncbi:hypothetical protein BDZ97DRAFT_1801285 [Flammula alnicola]|nr:hypothetical protein BDZ97DRAFT_1805579 [Flammula alnicola]KAF8968164.1 hypothetical protein BDZ97DRAFT_1801285 [Flammula alnicola]